LTDCGARKENCCAGREVQGGNFYRSYELIYPDGVSTDEHDPATISSFRLDNYDVTVGRFRMFVGAWNGGAGWVPTAGSGKHTHLNGGLGLANSASAGSYEPGWVASDNGNIAPTNANLGSCSPSSTWTNTPGSQENLPINCVTWFEAYAFCIWDGGFLPSEAEWEYAAAGGSQQREYPWGTTSPGTANQYAIYNCYYPSASGSCPGVANIAPVGTAALGAGPWGQLDLEGNVSQWNLDWYVNGSYVNPSTDGAYLTPVSPQVPSGVSLRVVRGFNFYYTASNLLPTLRGGSGPAGRDGGIGFRCARTP
jgi:sulfatase modifying factor 1